MAVRVYIYFDEYQAAELLTVAQVIHESMTRHAALFPALPVTMERFQEQILDYKAKLLARRSGAKSDVLALLGSRRVLVQMLRDLGQHVNSIARGNVTLAEMSGFKLWPTKRIPDLTPPPPPTDLRLKHGTLSGSILTRYRPPRHRAMHEIQVNLGNPSVESDWKQAGFRTGGKALLEGLPPGAVVWVRVRAVGLKGVMGAWSDPAQIRVV